MTPATRSLLFVTLLAGCYMASPEDQIEHCHKNGYSASTKALQVMCCSVVNGDDICLRASDVTKHRRQTGQ